MKTYNSKKRIRIWRGTRLAPLALVLIGFVSQAQTPACPTCEPLESAKSALEVPSEAHIKRAQDALIKFEFSTDANTRALEIDSMVRLGAKLVPADESGDSDAYFYNNYKLLPKEFDIALEKLSNPDKTYLRKSLRDTKRAFEKGNGIKSESEPEKSRSGASVPKSTSPLTASTKKTSKEQPQEGQVPCLDPAKCAAGLRSRGPSHLPLSPAAYAKQN